MATEYGMTTARGEGGKRNSPRKLSRIEIEIGANGGHTVAHHMARRGAGVGPYEEPKRHIFGPDDKDKLRDHLHSALGLSTGKSSKEPGDDEDEQPED